MAKSESKKVIGFALMGNLSIAIMKFIASFVTGSSALLAEGIHSLVDTGNQVLLLYGIKRAAKPPDEYYPFGYGKEIYFWSFIVAVLIFAIGAGLSIREGIAHIYSPTLLTNTYVSYIVLGIALIFEGAVFLYAFKKFRQSCETDSYIEEVQQGKDPAIFMVLFEDSAALLGILIAYLGIFLTDLTGNGFYDGCASILIGCLLGTTACWLAYETKGLLIGESANKHVVDGIKEIVANNKSAEHINEVLTMHVGPHYILVNLSIEFNDDIPANKIEKIIANMDKQIKTKFPEVKRVFIEAEAKPT